MAAILMAIGLLAFFAAIYLFVFIRPRAKGAPERRLITDYAHRGLHGDGVPENSLAAFALAAENGTVSSSMFSFQATAK